VSVSGKEGTMGTLATEAEIGVSVQAPGRFCGGPGVSQSKNISTLDMQNPAS